MRLTIHESSTAPDAIETVRELELMVWHVSMGPHRFVVRGFGLAGAIAALERHLERVGLELGPELHLERVTDG